MRLPPLTSVARASACILVFWSRCFVKYCSELQANTFQFEVLKCWRPHKETKVNSLSCSTKYLARRHTAPFVHITHCVEMQFFIIALSEKLGTQKVHACLRRRRSTILSFLSILCLVSWSFGLGDDKKLSRTANVEWQHIAAQPSYWTAIGQCHSRKSIRSGVSRPPHSSSKMSPRVPADERRRIVELSIQGFSQRVICRLLQRSRNAVSRAIQAYRQTGGISDRDRAGRSRCTDDEVDRLIIAAVVADPHISAKGIKDALHLNASVWTIRRRLAEAGLANCVAAQKPHITDRQRSMRLQFARSVQTWGSEEWGEVVFSDESTFSSRWDQERRVWRPMNSR